jgi:hypothetical protein
VAKVVQVGVLVWIVATSAALLLFTSDEVEAQVLANTPSEISAAYFQDAVRCSAFYTAASVCVDSEPDKAKALTSLGTRMLELATRSGETIGVSADATQAQLMIDTEDMAGEMHRNCNDIAIIVEKYRWMCSALVNDPAGVLRDRLSKARK